MHPLAEASSPGDRDKFKIMFLRPISSSPKKNLISGMTLSEHQDFRNGKNLAMRLLTILFLLSSFLQVNAQSFNDITIKKDRVSLETVFLEIEKQSEFRF